MNQRSLAHPSRGSAAVAIVIAVIVLGGAFAAYWFLLRDAGGSKARSLVAKVMPPEANVVVGIDLAGLLKSPALKEIAPGGAGEIDAIRKQLSDLKINPEDIDVLLLGMGEDPTDAVVVMQGRIDATAVKAALASLSLAGVNTQGLAETARFETLEGGVVIGGNGALYEKTLKTAREGNTGDESAIIGQLGKAIDKGDPIWAIGAIPKAYTRDFAEMSRGVPFDIGVPSHAAFSIGLGDPVSLKFALRSPGMDASSIASTVQMMLGIIPKSEMPPAAVEILKTLKVEGSGEILRAALSMKASSLKELTDRGAF